MMTLYALQELASITIEDKEEMANLSRINLTLSQSHNQSQEENFVLSNQLQILQTQMNSKKPATEKPSTENKMGIKNPKSY